MDDFLRFSGAVRRDPAIDAWFDDHAGDLGAIAKRWFEAMRQCGRDVHELVHDGAPTACVGDVPFAYVDAFRTHVNVGFFHGARLTDPSRLLEGTGKRMRHVKLRPGAPTDTTALATLIDEAYADIRRRIDVLESILGPGSYTR